MTADVSIRTERLVLRPFHLDEVEAAFHGLRALPANAHGPFTPKSKVRRMVATSGRFARGRLDLAIEAEGRLIGDVQARAGAQLLPKGVAEIGVAIYADADRGRGFGSEAVAALTGWLFESGFERVQAGTAVSNAAMSKSFEKLGFLREGVMRGFWPLPGGVREDFVLYAVTKTVWLSRG